MEVPVRRYEMMLIFPDTLEEDDATATLDRATSSIEDQGGRVVETAWWGKRQFAYEINKRTFGWYAVVDFELGDEGLREVERQLKINDNVLRFKTVRPQLRVRKPA